MVEWFGLTLYGVPDPIKDMMRPDYEEPLKQPGVDEIIARNPKKAFSDLIAELDCYLGVGDGFAYKSYERLIRMRNKGMFKPVGPMDMYKYPGTCAMVTTFWMADPALVGENWYRAMKYCPKPITDVTHY